MTWRTSMRNRTYPGISLLLLLAILHPLPATGGGDAGLPIWIPQGAMAFGAVAFFAAVAERAVRVWGGAAVQAQHGDVEVGRADR